jgi:hypothetical protein
MRIVSFLTERTSTQPTIEEARRRTPSGQIEARALYVVSYTRWCCRNRVYAHPGDGWDFEALVRYIMRSPISLSHPGADPG